MITLESVSVDAGQFSLRGIELSIDAGQWVALMGRTGCGKTTLLESICGLRRVSSGKIFVAGVDVTYAPPSDRQVGYVPQDLALFPTMTVEEQLQFSLRLRGISPAARKDRALELAEQLGITHLLNRKPLGLSGGEAQRVALGRALAFRPRVLLLDEPLSALDDSTRESLLDLLGQLRDTRSVSVLHVTHNRIEAERLGDRVIQLQDCCS